MKNKIISLLLLISLCASGCTVVHEDSEPSKTETYTPDIVYTSVKGTDYDAEMGVSAYDNFAFSLLSQIASSEADKNIMISPASVMFALDLAAAGACGDNLAQITSVLGGDMTAEEQQAFAGALMDKINSSETIDFSAANAIWNNADLVGDAINPEYVEYVQDMFDAQITTESFSSSTVDSINSWVRENTNGMIDQIISELSPDAAMVLINAIAFEAQWAEQYEEWQIESGEFNSVTNAESADYLNGFETAYFESDKAIGFLKNYEGGEYTFVVMLPKDESISANEFVSDFTADDWQEFTDSLTYEYDVTTKLPKFNYDYDTKLNGALQALGIVEAFDKDADFSGMADAESLYIDTILHKTHIELDENGTKAAAVTAVIMESATAMIEEREIKEVICDRPFAYAIVDSANWTPIFIGTVNSVA